MATNKEPRHVSVIVPTRRIDEGTRLLLDALGSQTFRDFEVVVVGEGELEPARLAEAGGLRVKFVRADGLGAFAKRCLGIEQAVGEILAFTDSDCIPEPGWLEAGVGALDAGADVVQGRTLPQRAVGPLERSISYTGRDGLYATCNVLCKRAAYDAAGGFEGVTEAGFPLRPMGGPGGIGFGEDTRLGWAVARCGTAVYVPGAVVRHEVIKPRISEFFSRAWHAKGFPRLVRDVPELRGRVVRDGPFLGGLGARHLVYCVALSSVASLPASSAVPSVAAAGFGGLWVGARGWKSMRAYGSLRDRATAFLVDLGTDVVTCAALVIGSVRGRSVVL